MRTAYECHRLRAGDSAGRPMCGGDRKPGLDTHHETISEGMRRTDATTE